MEVGGLPLQHQGQELLHRRPGVGRGTGAGDGRTGSGTDAGAGAAAGVDPVGVPGLARPGEVSAEGDVLHHPTPRVGRGTAAGSERPPRRRAAAVHVVLEDLRRRGELHLLLFLGGSGGTDHHPDPVLRPLEGDVHPARRRGVVEVGDPRGGEVGPDVLRDQLGEDPGDLLRGQLLAEDRHVAARSAHQRRGAGVEDQLLALLLEETFEDRIKPSHVRVPAPVGDAQECTVKPPRCCCAPLAPARTGR
jgi:hypothetical protein